MQRLARTAILIKTQDSVNGLENSKREFELLQGVESVECIKSASNQQGDQDSHTASDGDLGQ